jgi:hypothetical protein
MPKDSGVLGGRIGMTDVMRSHLLKPFYLGNAQLSRPLPALAFY